jgi:proline iminopeptidase
MTQSIGQRQLLRNRTLALAGASSCGCFAARTTQAVGIAAAALVWLACATNTHAAEQEGGSASSSGFADITGARLYYEIAGSGAPVVLIHGNAGDRRHWDAQFSALAREFRVIRYDARGYGRSSTPAEGTPYADHEDLAALLDYVGAAQAHVVGWSMGAAIAVDFAIRFPNRTLSVTAVGPWISGYTSSAASDVYAGFANVAIAAQQRGRDAALDAFMAAPFFAATSRDPSAREQFASIAAGYSFWAFAHHDPRRALNPPAAARLSEIQAPVLIVTGEHDIPACLEISTLLDETVRDSTKMVLPGAGHLVHMERPGPFNTVLAQFIRTADASNAPAARGVIPAGPFELRYQIEGRGRPAIVVGSPVYYSRVFSQSLREHLRIVFLEHRAFARKIGSVHPEDYTLDLIIDDIEHARRRLGLDRVAVIGHSGHAYMALEYAKRHPEHVSHVIMIGIAPDLSDASAAAAERYWQDFASAERKALLDERRRTLPDSQLEKLAPGPRFIQTYGIRDSPRSWYRLDFDPAPLWSGVEMNMEVFSYLWGDVFRRIDITRGLDRFDRPVFIALGRHDFVVAPPSSWDPITPKLQDVTVRIFEQSGHTPQYEQAEQFDAELLKWMDARR